MPRSAVVAVIVAGSTGVAALLVPRQLRPNAAARLITSLVLMSCGAAVWTLFLIVGANVVQLHGVAERLSWCHDLAAHHSGTFTPLGLAALVAVGLASFSAIRVGFRQRREPTQGDDREVAIVASEYPVAYALRGDPGQIVVSTAMLRSLDPLEQRVLLAHERSHLRRRHHRYIRATEFAIAASPFLAPLNARLRFALERWADEDAAAEVGDRAVVACAIARAALAIQSSPATSLGMADCAVVERVATMLAGPSQRSVVLEAAFTGVAIAGAVGLAASLALLGHMLPALRICL